MTGRVSHQGALDRAAVLQLLDALDRNAQQQAAVLQDRDALLAALRQLVAPEEPDGRPAPPVVGAEIISFFSRDPDRIAVKAAALDAGVHETTVLRWIRTDPTLAARSRGQWWVSRSVLQKHIEDRKES